MNKILFGIGLASISLFFATPIVEARSIPDGSGSKSVVYKTVVTIKPERKADPPPYVAPPSQRTVYTVNQIINGSAAANTTGAVLNGSVFNWTSSNTTKSTVTNNTVAFVKGASAQISGFYQWPPDSGAYYAIGVPAAAPARGGGGGGGGAAAPVAPPAAAKPTGIISGTVYYDPTNTCSTAQPWNQSAVLTVSLRGVSGSGTVSGGNFGMLVEQKTYGYLDLNGMPSGFKCSTACAQACPTKTSVISPSVGNNFFLSDKAESWWQTEGAGVYAGGLGGGVTVRSQLPNATQHLIEPGVGGSIGALLRASGSVDTGSGTVSTPGYNTQAHYKGKKMSYEYFAAQMGVVKGQTSNWESDALTLPTYDAAKDFLYSKPTSGTSTISAPWNVGVGEKYVVFIDGDLKVDNNIQVPVGGFLMFIVSGKITIDPAVTILQGIYLSNGNFVTASKYVLGVTNDVQLNVAGIVITWGALSIGRDLGPTNTTAPAEKFTYRTDLLTNMPSRIKTFATEWQEVVSGTFNQ